MAEADLLDAHTLEEEKKAAQIALAALAALAEQQRTDAALKRVVSKIMACAPTMKKLGSIPRTPTLRVLAAQQDLAFCFFLY